MDFHFLLSSERSGSNFFTKMLDGHPSICGPSPTHLIRTFSQNIFNYGDLSIDTNWNALALDIVDYVYFQLGVWSTRVDTLELSSLKPRRLATLIRYIYEKEAKACCAKTLFIKENRVYDFLPYLLSSFPAAKFIYLVRDPRDFALSHKRSPNHPGSVINAVEVWKRDQHAFLQCYSFLKNSGRVMRIRYEDLLSHQEQELKNVCMFLNFDFSFSMVDFYKKELTKTNAGKIKNWVNLGKPTMKNNYKKYRKELHASEIKYIENSCSGLMALFKYKLDYDLNSMSSADERFVTENEEVKNIGVDHSAEEIRVRENRLAILNRILTRRAH